MTSTATVHGHGNIDKCSAARRLVPDKSRSRYQNGVSQHILTKFGPQNGGIKLGRHSGTAVEYSARDPGLIMTKGAVCT